MNKRKRVAIHKHRIKRMKLEARDRQKKETEAGSPGPPHVARRRGGASQPA